MDFRRCRYISWIPGKSEEIRLTNVLKHGILSASQGASVAQLVEHHVANVIVAGSIPVTRSSLWQDSSVGRAGD